MRVFISSTSEDLEAYRAAARDVVSHLGWQPVRMEDFGTDGSAGVVEACAKKVADADLVLAILGWRRGGVPPAERGGDGESSFTKLELDAAFAADKPVLVLMADDMWPGKLWEEDRDALTWVRTFRRELDRPAVFFEWEGPEAPLPVFASKVREELLRHRRPDPPPRGSDVRLRGRRRLELPEEPYPVLLPYDHPRLFAGRRREIDELRKLLRGPVPILLLHAPSGAGKSSLLRAGLAPALDQEGVPVALDRYPAEAGLGRRLIRDLLVCDDWPDGLPPLEETDADVVALFGEARLLAGKAPVLLVDQFEDVFRRPRHRAGVGMLLAASIRHQPAIGDPALRWVLAYRQEFHGEVRAWLTDVLSDARRAGVRGLDHLPHDLSGIERCRDWPLPTLGTRPGGDPADAVAAFRNAIEAPLGITDEGGQPRYALRFADDGPERLAAAFAESRARRPEAPLVPELQVVLAELRRRAGDGPVEVPEDVGELIARALENHLRVALDRAFPPTRGDDNRTARTRALLGLRELADAEGRRGAGLPAAELARAFAPEGEATLERLAAADTRLIVARHEHGVLCCALSHDRMAEVVVRIVEEEGRHGALDVDPELLRLRRYVGIMTDLYHAGETLHATRLPAQRFEAVRVHAEALLWDQDRQRWWTACEERQQDERTMLLGQLSSGATPKALEALAALVVSCGERNLVGQRLAQRDDRCRLFEQGPLNLADHEREEIVLGALKNAGAYFESVPDDLDSLGAAVWALDYFVGRSAEGAAAVREALLEPLRRQCPPPDLDEDAWAAIPDGRFDMGTADDGSGADDERPRHRVTISPFRMLVHAVTNRQFRQLVPDHTGDDDLPAVDVDWYRAYAYAAWLGGRLPTEAEWEYAARAGCPHPYCDRHGNATTLDKVGWYSDNSGRKLHPVMQREPNPWGLYDLYGNAWEWVADWYAKYPDGSQVDPWGPPSGGGRVIRGGGFGGDARWARAANRNGGDPEIGSVHLGFRVVLPAAPSD